MARDKYTLNELTEAAGVSARTVRYYIAEGLIPPPTAAGPRASYTSGHLNRLRLIGELKIAYLPLREIRRQLDGISDGEIAAMLQHSETLERFRESPNQPRVAESASSYLDGALRGSSIRRLLSPSPGEPLSIVDSDSSHPIVGDEPQDTGAIPQIPHRLEQRIAPHPARRSAPAEGSAWRRIELGPDAELLIREDAYTRKRERIEWLINWAKRVFN